MAALRTVSKGGLDLNPKIARRLRGSTKGRNPGLSRCELELMQEVANGHNDREIAERLHLATDTVEIPPGAGVPETHRLLPQPRRHQPRAAGDRCATTPAPAGQQPGLVSPGSLIIAATAAAESPQPDPFPRRGHPPEPAAGPAAAAAQGTDRR